MLHSEEPDYIEPEEGGDKLELGVMLLHALKEIPSQLEMIPMSYCLRGAARKNDKRPAYMEVYVPDPWVVNLTKNQKLLDGYVAVRIPREFIQTHLADRQLGKA